MQQLDRPALLTNIFRLVAQFSSQQKMEQESRLPQSPGSPASPTGQSFARCLSVVPVGLRFSQGPRMRRKFSAGALSVLSMWRMSRGQSATSRESRILFYGCRPKSRIPRVPRRPGSTSPFLRCGARRYRPAPGPCARGRAGSVRPAPALRAPRRGRRPRCGNSRRLSPAAASAPRSPELSSLRGAPRRSRRDAAATHR